MSQPAFRSVPPAGTGQGGLDRQAFRRALGSFVTGVTVVTTLDREGRPAGLTANSFNSVSLDPPMVLWSLSLDSTSLTAFREAGWWAVHVLAADQQDLSDRFARREHDKFEGVHTTAGPDGIPLLDGSAARFICRAAFEYEGGDHAIFLGAVQAFEQTGASPLVYHQGRYGGVVPHVGDDAADSALARQGLTADRDGVQRLNDQGARLAEGLVGLAEGCGLSPQETETLSRLLDRLKLPRG